MRITRWVAGLVPLAAAAAVVLGAEEPVLAEDRGPVDLGALFVGAHPDDESSLLSTFGRWKAEHGVRTGVVTITRGEGGGNAAGPEEGPELGRIREAEERRAVAAAGITEVFNLDKADFYYTVSSPLTRRAWGHEDTLGRLVRLVRQTRPEIVVTMDPAPTPGNHGNHQYSGRLAVEAYRAAADPGAYPEQISREGLRPWAVSKIFITGTSGERKLGPSCVDSLPAGSYGVWSGVAAPGGGTWAQVERKAQREYVSQGWAGFPDVPTDPAKLGCDYFTEVVSRVPGAASMLEGAILPGALPPRTGLSVEVDRFAVVAGASLKVRVTATADRVLPDAKAVVSAPPGWTVSGRGHLGTVVAGRPATTEFTVTVPAGAQPGRVRLPIELSSMDRRGAGAAVVEVTAPVRAEQQALPQVSEFRDWARGAGAPALADLVPPVLTLPSGGARDIDVHVVNHGTTAQSGTVEMALPKGFAADTQSKPFEGLAPGATTTVRFAVRNTDATMPTGMKGGDYAYSITTRPQSGPASTSKQALELVPTTTITQASAPPVVDGVAGPGEYTGRELDLSTRWEGSDCESAADCSATARLSWHGDTLHALVKVTDDKLGSTLATADCKRHWRTDSVEITLDPRGRSENTSSTFKLAALPVTTEGPACALRDADNHQGSATGVRVASKVSQPYTGYTVEVAIPLSALPGAVDPANLGLNVLVYDSDTRDKTGQTRIGWSTWGGVQGDPYRWGRAVLGGFPAPPERPATPPALPLVALSSVDSPQSVEQAVRTGVPLGGSAASRSSARVVLARVTGSTVDVQLVVTGAGRANVFVLDRAGSIVGKQVLDVRPGAPLLGIGLTGTPARVVVGFQDPNGGTAASVFERI
ncbi:sugar-binding protein [Allokutzneria oryzae]|uniref:Sugar-binding protein n=1 Tax=Allokutzneria oryzae TaxID=1378989 RepID=A0ABV5ZP49_9PSEU